MFMGTLYDPGIPGLSIYPREVFTHYQEREYTKIVIKDLCEGREP